MELSNRALGMILIFAFGGGAAVSLFDSLPQQSESTVSAYAPPDVYLIVAESVRSDHVGPCYGYNRSTAPRLCGLAQDGVMFEHAYAQGTHPGVSIPVLLTSEPPNAVGFFPDEHIADDFRTIGERLANWQYARLLHSREAHIAIFNRTQWADRLPNLSKLPETPLYSFTFITEQARFPYTPAPSFRRWTNISNMSRVREPDLPRELASNISRDAVIDLYDGEIRQMDGRVGAIIDELKERGRYRDAMIIVTSSNGELLGKPENPNATERWGHGAPPSRALVHVPLIIKFPDNRFSGRTVPAPVRHIDLAPTVFDVTGVPTPEDLSGRSLLSVIRRERSVAPFAAQFPDRIWAAWNRSHFRQVEDPSVWCQRRGNDLYRRTGTRFRGASVQEHRFDDPLLTAICAPYNRGRD